MNKWLEGEAGIYRSRDYSAVLERKIQKYRCLLCLAGASSAAGSTVPWIELTWPTSIQSCNCNWSKWSAPKTCNVIVDSINPRNPPHEEAVQSKWGESY